MEPTSTSNTKMRPVHLSAVCPQCNKRIFGFKTTTSAELDVTCPKCNSDLVIQINSKAISIALA